MSLERFRALVVGLSSAVMVACGAGGLFGPSSHDDLALIIMDSDTSRIVAPDTVTRGVPFVVSFGTFGGGCTRSVARTDVTTAGSSAEIRPYDRTVRSDVCTADLLFLQHVAQVRFDAPGIAVLHVIGQQVGTSGSLNGPAELLRLVTVR